MNLTNEEAVEIYTALKGLEHELAAKFEAFLEANGLIPKEPAVTPKIDEEAASAEPLPDAAPEEEPEADNVA